MNTSLREYDVVRIIKLIQPSRDYMGTSKISRPPKIGDVATICDYYPQSPFTVEMVDQEGRTVWLADFIADKLEFVSRPLPQKKSN